MKSKVDVTSMIRVSQHIYSVWETTQLMMYKAQGSDLVLTQTSKCTVDSGVYTSGEVHLSIATD